MKKRSFILVFLLFTQLCFAQTVKNSLLKQHLKGKIKRIETSSFNGDPKDGKIDTLAPNDKLIDLYDENGNNVEYSHFGNDGLLTFKSMAKYNDKNEKIEEDYFEKIGVLKSSTIFKYDARGNLVESNDKTNTDKTLYTYDDKGNNLEVDAYANDGGFKYKYTYKYDSKGNKIETDYWRANEDTIRMKWTFDYNDAGFPVKQGMYSSRGEVLIENIFTYENFDSTGNWLLQTKKSQNENKQYAGRLSYSVTKRKIYYY